MPTEPTREIKKATIAEMFSAYLDVVYVTPEGEAMRPAKGSVQYIEMRRCFYGAWAVAYAAIQHVSCECTEDVACEFMTRWQDEIIAFNECVKHGMESNPEPEETQ